MLHGGTLPVGERRSRRRAGPASAFFLGLVLGVSCSPSVPRNPDDICDISTAMICSLGGGVYQGNGTSCDSVSCDFDSITGRSPGDDFGFSVDVLGDPTTKSFTPSPFKSVIPGSLAPSPAM